MMEVEEISIDVIKPSSPTPSHLKTHQFSLFDQYIAHAYLSVPLFYSSNTNTNTNTNTNPQHILTHLKTSLSKTLTLFYPLAGRLNNPHHHHILCNDEGVEFVHARVRNCTLSQALAPPDHRLYQLFPKQHTTGDQLLGIQLTFFECGGFAIGVYFSHKIFDARSLCTFVLSWASIAKIGESVVHPRFDSASIFPPIDQSESLFYEFDATERVMFKVFRFEGSKIELLKAKAKGSGDERPPSRAMAVTALLWTVLAAMDRGPNPRPCRLGVGVSMRGRLRTDSTDPEVPIFHEHTIGNAVLLPFTPPMAPSRDLTELPSLVKVLGDEVRKIEESDLVGRRDGREVSKMMESYIKILVRDYGSSDEGESGLYEIVSWLRFLFYEADFGWGKPVWFGYLIGDLKNIIMLLEAKCGKGIDVWVWMTEEDMARFESVPELLEFATPLHNALDY
ncbi:hypothetical protein Syun_004770 [Stephania yunnanensis]|uniref:Uncharacterized protein n=1 Tax=Stephania yunnanensis TaxID=152371 RepID=A0AAP0Q1K8_9MAGN